MKPYTLDEIKRVSRSLHRTALEGEIALYEALLKERRQELAELDNEDVGHSWLGPQEYER